MCENVRSQENTASHTVSLQGSPASTDAVLMPRPTDASTSRSDIKNKKKGCVLNGTMCCMKGEKVSAPLDTDGRNSGARQHAYGQGIATYFMASNHGAFLMAQQVKNLPAMQET